MKFLDLQFVRLSIEKPEQVNSMLMLFDRIPRELFEQVKDNSFDIDKIYKFAQSILSNPMNQFYVLVHDKKIKGIFWAAANVLCDLIDVHILSIDKEYQFDDAIAGTLKFINTFQEDAKVRIVASRTAKYEKAGFEKTKTVMEIQNTVKE